jgi:predicted negative regulator of RcsB-dependent stress response
LEDAQMRFDALRRGAGQDAELARLRAELAALNGDNPTETPAEPAQMQLAEAAATVGRLKAQLENLETRIRQADEELLRIHGAA